MPVFTKRIYMGTKQGTPPQPLGMFRKEAEKEQAGPGRPLPGGPKGFQQRADLRGTGCGFVILGALRTDAALHLIHPSCSLCKITGNNFLPQPGPVNMSFLG